MVSAPVDRTIIRSLGEKGSAIVRKNVGITWYGVCEKNAIGIIRNEIIIVSYMNAMVFHNKDAIFYKFNANQV